MAEIISKRKYGWVWLTLLLLLFATWLFSRFDFGAFNVVIAIGISFVKMILILLYFMHLRHSDKIIWIAAAAGFIWLFILIELTLSDYLTRGSAWSQ